MLRSIPFVLAALAFGSGAAQAATSTFDDLPLAPNSNYAPGTSGNGSGAFPFTSGDATFNHQFSDWGGGYTSWSGWAYSSQTDTTTAGYGNQYSSYAGTGQGGSQNYAVGYGDSASATLAGATVLGGAWFTNTTYAALSMRDGDGFAKRFGGTSGNDADFFTLTISGYNGATSTGSIDFMLADYRFVDNTQDYIVHDWTFVDLRSLGAVDRLAFSLSSSDSGAFGINTPAYFAMDSLAPVPEPEQAAMLLAGLLLVGGTIRKRRKGMAGGLRAPESASGSASRSMARVA